MYFEWREIETEREFRDIFHRMCCLEAVFSLIFGELDLFAGLLMELCKKLFAKSRSNVSSFA